MFNKTSPAHLLQGERSEQLACDFLEKQGLKVVEKNFRCKQGELDLILCDQDTLVIVEVRFRKTNAFGGAIESITQKKQSRIIAATEYYLMVNKINSPIRLDVITMSNDTDINWIQNAIHS